MLKTSPLKIAGAIMLSLLCATVAQAGSPARSGQEMRNLDIATKMHGLQEADHGRIYGWGQHDNYGDAAKTGTDDTKEADDKPPQEQRQSPMHRFHPHAEDGE